MKKPAKVILVAITILFTLTFFSTCARISSDTLGSSGSSNSSGSSGGSGSTEKITLNTPQNVRASINGNKITVTWNSVSGAKKYEIRWIYIGDYRYYSSSSTSCSITVTTAGTYSFYVRACDGGSGYSYWSSASNGVKYNGPRS